MLFLCGEQIMKAKKIIFIALAVLLQMVLCSRATVDLDGER